MAPGTLKIFYNLAIKENWKNTDCFEKRRGTKKGKINIGRMQGVVNF